MTGSPVEWIRHGGKILAGIIPGNFRAPGVHFLTPQDQQQQVAVMSHPAGKVIIPHVHNPAPRQVGFTQEVLIIRQGKLRVDFYTSEREYIESRILGKDDIILLIEGGHGFEVLEPLEMIEVKQGPFVGDHDKTRFEGISSAQAVLPKSTSQKGQK